jgi:hypothetical protein
MRRLVPALLALSLLPAASAAAAPPAWEQNSEAIGCADTPGTAPPKYDPPSASAVYDGIFGIGHAVPDQFLNNWVPQGLGTWPNWGGSGSDLLIQSGYNDNHKSAIVGIAPGGGTTQIARLKNPDGTWVDAHVGGVAVVGSWLFVSGQPRSADVPTILRFPLSAVRTALDTGNALQAAAEIPLNVGTANFAASFIASDDGTLWVGTFNPDNRNRMYQFTVGPYGGLDRVGGADNWRQVPKKAQGLTVTNNHFIFSTSQHVDYRSNVYVERRGYKYLDDAYPGDLTCFAAPTMSEGVTRSNGITFLSFESGSYKYRGSALNVITHLHRTPTSTLTSMT